MLDDEPILTKDGQVHSQDHTHNSEGAGGFSTNLFVNEYGTLLEQLHAFAGFFDVFTVLYPQLLDIRGPRRGRRPTVRRTDTTAR